MNGEEVSDANTIGQTLDELGREAEVLVNCWEEAQNYVKPAEERSDLEALGQAVDIDDLRDRFMNVCMPYLPAPVLQLVHGAFWHALDGDLQRAAHYLCNFELADVPKMPAASSDDMSASGEILESCVVGIA